MIKQTVGKIQHRVKHLKYSHNSLNRLSTVTLNRKDTPKREIFFFSVTKQNKKKKLPQMRNVLSVCEKKNLKIPLEIKQNATDLQSGVKVLYKTDLCDLKH